MIHDIQDEYQDLNIYSIIEPTCAQLAGKGFKKINVLATKKTVEKHAYRDALLKVCPNAQVNEIKAVKLVPIIEGGCDMAALREAAEMYSSSEADAWVLGCTHFPLIRPFINGKGAIFDSNQAVVDLFQHEQIGGHGRFEIYTTGDPEEMKKSIQSLFDCDYDVHTIQLKQSK